MNNDPLNPDSDYVVPKGDSKYLKFEKGETEFMPLSSAITGWEYWTNENKPVRLTEEPKNYRELPDIKIKDGKADIKAFWAFAVWDYADQSVKVLEITQKTIMSALRNYTKNAKWGSPVMKYSFTVTREGDGLDTEYTVMANPAGDIDPEIVESWHEVKTKGFDLNELYKSGDPFAPVA